MRTVDEVGHAWHAQAVKSRLILITAIGTCLLAAFMVASAIVVGAGFVERPPARIETSSQFWMDYMLPTRLVPGLVVIVPIAVGSGIATYLYLRRAEAQGSLPEG